MESNKLKTAGEMYFCSADIRPDRCLKGLKQNLCCLHCNLGVRCLEENRNSKVKPCNTKVIGMDEVCEWSL